MKHISRLALSLVFATALVAPLFAFADATNQPVGALCYRSPECSSNFCDGSTGRCAIPSANGVPYTPSGGGININALTPYSSGIINFVNLIMVPVLFALAFITFLWGVFKYFIYHGEEEKSREEGKQFVFWGIIGFVVILSVWGLVNIVSSTFNLTPGSAVPKYPTL